MAITVTHAFVSPVADGPSATKVKPSNWNSPHDITGTIDAAGANTQVQFNDGGTFGGNVNLTYDKINSNLIVDGIDGKIGVGMTPSLVDTFPVRISIATDAVRYWGYRVAGYNGGAFTAYTATLSNIGPDVHVSMNSGNLLAHLHFEGSDGTDFRDAAAIQINVDDAPAAGTVPGMISFWTTPSGVSQNHIERMRIDSRGQVGIGFRAALPGDIPLQGGEPVSFSVAVNTVTNYAEQFLAYGNNDFQINQNFKKTRGTSPTDHVILQPSDWVFVASYQASNGTNYTEIGSIDVHVDTQAPSGGGMPGLFDFVTADGTGAGSVVRYKIDSLGNNIFGSGAGALATTATAGFIYYVGCPGVPTAAPTRDYTGTIPTIIDTLNKRFYAYIGGAWTAI